MTLNENQEKIKEQCIFLNENPRTILIDSFELECEDFLNEEKIPELRLQKSETDNKESSVKVLYLWINSDDEGNIPHFHFGSRSAYLNKSNKTSFYSGTIMINDARYFQHGENHYTSVIRNPKNLKILDSRLRETPKKQEHLKMNLNSYWEVICYIWNQVNNAKDNGANRAKPNLGQPDYTKLA